MSATPTAPRTCSVEHAHHLRLSILRARWGRDGDDRPSRGLDGTKATKPSSFRDFYGDGGRALASMPGVVVQDDADLIASILTEPFDAVVAIDFPELVNALYQVGTDVPVIFESHAGYLSEARRFYEAVNHPVVRGVLVPAELNRRRILEMTRTSKPVSVVPNVIDPERFAKQPNAVVQEEWGTLADAKVIVWVGRLEEAKNPLEAIAIAAIVAAADPDVKLLMVGDSPHHDARTEEVLTAGAAALDGRFELRRSVPFEHMPLLYSLAATTGGCLLSTSLAESSPMTFLEAMACECPIVSSHVEGIESLVSDGSRGWLYQLGDVLDGVRAVEAAIDPPTPDLRQSVIDGSLAYVRAEHGPGPSARIYTRELEELISSDTHAARPLRVVAVITTTNDEDVVSPAIERLVEDGVEVHLIDHGSSDDTIDEASRWFGRGLIGMESHPIAPGGGIGEIVPEALLGRSQEIWRTAGADWCMHRSVAEISYGPWPAQSLLEAIKYADWLGYTAIQSRVLTFRPIDDSFRKGSDPATHFSFWEDEQPDMLCWQRGVPPDQHIVFPVRFVTCRYPIRNLRQAPEGQAWEPSGLHRFSLEEVRLENALSNNVRGAGRGNGKVHAALKETMETEDEVVSRALELVSRRRASNSPMSRRKVSAFRSRRTRFPGPKARGRHHRLEHRRRIAGRDTGGRGTGRRKSAWPADRKENASWYRSSWLHATPYASMSRASSAASETIVTRKFWPRPREEGSAAGLDTRPRRSSANDADQHRVRVRAWSTGRPVLRRGLLSRHAEDIRGRVLEVQDDSYATHFGAGRLDSIDIVDYTDENAAATLIADLNQPGSLPAERFDCVVFTQTLPVLSDPETAIANIHRSLREGGVVLATFPASRRPPSTPMISSGG